MTMFGHLPAAARCSHRPYAASKKLPPGISVTARRVRACSGVGLATGQRAFGSRDGGTPPFCVRLPAAQPVVPGTRSLQTRASVALLPAVIGLGVVNRVLNKMVLVPMGTHAIFLAQTQTLIYTLVYSAILAARFRAGIVTPDVLRCALRCWPLFIVIGGLEAMGTLLLFTATALLPGAAVPLLQQSLLLWNFLLSMVFLGRKFTRSEVLGAMCVMTGVVVASSSCQSVVGAAAAIPAGPAALFLLAMLLVAVDSITKERVFKFVRKETGKPLDIFVVNTLCSISQGLATFALLPLVLWQQGLSPSDLPLYLQQGAGLLFGITEAGRNAGGSLAVSARYIVCNLLFNIAALAALRSSGAATLAVTMTAVVPLTIFAFTFDLPLIGVAPPLTSNFWFGAGLVLAGMVAYYSKMIRTQKGPESTAAAAA